MSEAHSGDKRKAPIQESIHAAAKKKRRIPEQRTRIVWKQCGCSAFITPQCKYQNGFTHWGITKSCTDYESSRILRQPHVNWSDCTVFPQVFIRPPERSGENNHEVPTASEPPRDEATGLPQDIPAVQDNFNPSDWCYSQLDWYFDTP
uniref:Transcriptional activator protein n=1 Tax=Sweet potato leaf curl China Sichuan virus TaxID=1295014 RepID=A0A023PND8_9GEMI|nr:AC2 [Sweet potato leaf curl China Sichuan virus]